jgi:hypothetical protein
MSATPDVLDSGRKVRCSGEKAAMPFAHRIART